MIFPDFKRLRWSIKLAMRHLSASLAIAGLAAIFVFLAWYPAPSAEMQKVGNIYLLLLFVDVICGPLLTLVLASPKKKRREMILDFSLVAAVQMAALGYGLYALAEARPVAYVFETDRLVLVTKNEIYAADCTQEIPCPQLKKNWGIDLHIAQLNKAGMMRSLELSLQGVSPAMRPATWRQWDWADPELQAALRPLGALRMDQKERLTALKGDPYLLRPELRYLPLVSAKTLDWIVVFDAQGGWIDTLPIDGFQ